MNPDDQILTKVTVDAFLDSLSDENREMMILIYRIDQPDDWDGPWPPRFVDIGKYIGMKYGDHPLSEAAIRYRRDTILKRTAKNFAELRKNAS